jgi:hypothetical protein
MASYVVKTEDDGTKTVEKFEDGKDGVVIASNLDDDQEVTDAINRDRGYS